MIGKLPQNQPEIFRTRLEDLINPNHELALIYSLHKNQNSFWVADVEKGGSLYASFHS